MKKIYFLLVILCISLQSLYSVEFDRSQLPKLLGANNWGREFYFSFIPSFPPFAKDLKIYISSKVKTKVIVEVQGKQYSKTKYTIPNDIIEFTLSPGIGEVYHKPINEPPLKDNVFTNHGVHVKSDDPIICYAVTKYRYISEGFVVSPINTLGMEYIISSYPDMSNNNDEWIPSMLAVTAAYDKTKVLFLMGGTDSSRTVSGQKPGDTTRWNMNKGDVLFISSLGHLADLTGCKIISLKPVSVVSGNYLATIPTDSCCQNIIEEMELPTETWGKTYHITPILGRLKNSIIRIFAKEPNTNIYKDNILIGTIQTSGGVAGIGWLDMRADTGKPKPITIHSDKPIGITQYNTGQHDDGITSAPFQMVLVPTEQYQTEITFNTPGIRGGFGFSQNYMNLCYEATDSNTIPEDLEFASVEGGEFVWQSLKEMTPNPGDSFIDVNSKNYNSKTIRLPGDGVYKIRANKPFQAYMYGSAEFDSYGFPASVALKKLDLIDTLPPKPEWKMDCRGNVNKDSVRYVTDKPDVPAPSAKLSMIYMSSDLSYNYKLNYSEFMPCEDDSTAWSLETLDPLQDALVVVTFADCNGNDSIVVIEYNAPVIHFSSKSEDFGTFKKGDSLWKTMYLSNNSDNPKYCNSFRLKNQDHGFSLWNKDKSGAILSPFTIPPHDTLHFWIKFNAFTDGNFWDSLGFGDNCFFSYQIYFQSSVGIPIIEVSDWNFPPTIVNSRAFGQFDIKNLGSVNLVIYGYDGPSQIGTKNGLKIYESSDLDQRNISATNKLVMTPGQVITMNLSFTPDDTLSFPDSIKFISNSIKRHLDGDLVDSVCSLSGRGLISILSTTSYNWERKRIHRDNFPAGPFPPIINSMNADTCIKFFNSGNQSTTMWKIDDLNIEGDKNTFIFDKTKIIGSTVNAHSKLVVPVYCQPLQTGYHLYTFRILTDNQEIKDLQTTLQVIGILPKITTEDVNLGGTEINDFNNPAKINIIINNIEWQFQDSVTISDIECANINTNNNTNWNDISESFRIDKSALKFPIVLQPGDTLEIPIEFVAKEMTEYSATVTTVSDAEQDVSAVISGFGAEPGAVEEHNKEIKIYPNPTEDILIIDKLPLNTTKIQIFDELGDEVRTIDIKNQSESMKISTKDLHVGVYVLRMFVGSEVVDRKFGVMR